MHERLVRLLPETRRDRAQSAEGERSSARKARSAAQSKDTAAAWGELMGPWSCRLLSAKTAQVARSQLESSGWPSGVGGV